ncbi:hypothetical protein [Tautonia plasticadhaerens]|uniref:Uncharacterized protein n=1 Tax=Tautonia plasticadhaerens TaxID=2527974 RepID=A0A518GX12_9BACT|nr:hypothetical protein [Tautonia plasticadhaerens]QDV33102.1 hypothetical protein ElP_09440 [Tautonia plasticadhaerens]
MFRRNRDDHPAVVPPAPASVPASDRRRHTPDRRRRPSLEGLEARQLLSNAPPMASAAVSSPVPGPSASSAPVVFRHTPLPTLRAWSGQPFEGAVASFIANTRIPADQLSATIDWGDGQASPGVIQPSPWGGFYVRGAHAYGPGTSGMTWVRVDVSDARTGGWLVGVEQRMAVSQPSASRAALVSAGFQPAASQADHAARPQPARLRFVERRQRYHDATDRFARGEASAEDIRYVSQVRDFIEDQNKSYFEKLGDTFVDSIPFT